MMPFCYWRGCKKVATTRLGVIKDFIHPYLCDKHFKKILKLLGIQYKKDGDYR